MAAAHSFPWDRDSGLDPATLQRMGDEFGSVHETRQDGRRPRWRIYLGTRNGKILWLSRMPSRAGAQTPPFESHDQAEALLEMMRSAIRAGFQTPDEVIDDYLPHEFSKELIETWVAKYLAHWRSAVESGDRSPTSHRELVRWAKSDGHWGYWWGRDVRSLTNGDATEWHHWLTKRGIKPKTRKNVSDAFRAFLNWASEQSATGTGKAWSIPVFPSVTYAKPKTATLPVDRVLKILDAIPWDRRGIFLANAFESVRFGAAAAALLEDYDPKSGELHWHRARKGQRVDSPVGSQKNREVTRRKPWHPELVRWLEWRTEQVTPEQRLSGEATALFWFPDAHNAQRTWNDKSYRRTWKEACKAVNEDIGPQAGTRHSVLSRLAEVLTPDALQAQSQHRSLESLSHYTVGAKANHAAMVQAIRPQEEGD